MLQYIGDDSYLQLHMNLLRDESKTIQVEAGVPDHGRDMKKSPVENGWTSDKRTKNDDPPCYPWEN